MSAKIHIVIDSRLLVSGAEGRLRDEIMRTFMHRDTKTNDIVSTYRELPNGDLSIPRGGMDRIRFLCRKYRVERTVEDRRFGGEPHGESFFFSPTLRDYQTEALDAIFAKENCLLRAPTGVGKTTIGLALAARVGVPTLVLVGTERLQQQWMVRARREIGVADVGHIGGGKWHIRPITIAMQPSLRGKVSKELLDYFGCVIFDEVHGVAARTCFDTVDQFPARYRVGISADETRPDGKEFLIYDLFGATASEIEPTRAIEGGHVVDVEVRVLPTAFTASWWRPMLMRGGFWARKAHTRLLEEMTTDVDRNDLMMRWIDRELRDGSQIIVLSHRVEHVRQIDAKIAGLGFRSGVILGAVNSGGKRENARTCDGLIDGTYRAAVGSVKIVGQALDFPAVEAAFVATPIRNRQQLKQAQGRVCRSAEGKTGARLYVPWDRSIHGEKLLNDLVAWCRNVVVWDGTRWVRPVDYRKGQRAVA